uniref:Uncharacterized protein n=1 Tax=Anguilla anguilla TaxID=7936 RepID=A0A0E9SPQ9_ANGAN
MKVLEEVKGILDKSKIRPHRLKKIHISAPALSMYSEIYLAIFPLWSGLLLGDLRRYTSETEEMVHGPKNTNFHVEKWFGIV